MLHIPSVTPCPAGEGRVQIAGECQPCPEGFYDDALSDYCSFCPRGFTHTMRGATDVSACTSKFIYDMIPQYCSIWEVGTKLRECSYFTEVPEQRQGNLQYDVSGAKFHTILTFVCYLVFKKEI